MDSEPIRPSILLSALVLALSSTGLAFGLEAVQKESVVDNPLVMLGMGYLLASFAGMTRPAGVTIPQALTLGFACFFGALMIIATGMIDGDGPDFPLAALAVFGLYSLLAAIVVMVASKATRIR